MTMDDSSSGRSPGDPRAMRTSRKGETEKLDRLIREIACLYSSLNEETHNDEWHEACAVEEAYMKRLSRTISKEETTYLCLECQSHVHTHKDRYGFRENRSYMDLIVSSNSRRHGGSSSSKQQQQQHRPDFFLRMPAREEPLGGGDNSTTMLVTRILSLVAFLSESVIELELVGFGRRDCWDDDTDMLVSLDEEGFPGDDQEHRLVADEMDINDAGDQQMTDTDEDDDDDDVVSLDTTSEGRARISDDGSEGNKPGEILPVISIEDVFRAFANEGSSSWRTKRLKIVRVRDCDMWRDVALCLPEDRYPEALEEIYIHDPKWNRVSSAIFQIAALSPKLRLLYAFDKNNSQNERRYSCQLTEGAINSLCEILSRTNELFGMQQLPYRELFYLPEGDIRKLVEATAVNCTARMSHEQDGKTRFNQSGMDGVFSNVIQYDPNQSGRHRLLSMMPPIANKKITCSIPPPVRMELFDIRNCTIRSSALNFSLVLKRSLEVLQATKERNGSRLAKLAPTVLARCQTKPFSLLMFGHERDLLYAVLQESLADILSSRP